MENNNNRESEMQPILLGTAKLAVTHHAIAESINLSGLMREG
jgi:hypothetical protein